MKTLLAIALWIHAGTAAAAPATSDKPVPLTFERATRDLERREGFVDVYRDPEQGRVLIALRELDAPFLLYTSLPYGLGSNDVGLDRGQIGDGKLVEFRRVGKRVLLFQRNTRFVAGSSDPLERKAVEQAFAESVLWAGDIVAERALPKQALLIDFTSYLTADRHGIARALADAKQGKYAVDEARSVPSFAALKSFPDNAELEAILTFAGSGPEPDNPQWVRDVAVDAGSLTVRQHVSLVRLPAPGFRSRLFHPASGGIDTGFLDFAQPLSASLDVRHQIRHRLERVDPKASSGPVKKPIVYYLDAGTPEPVRSALLEGARWWGKAFEAAGFQDAFRVELMPPDMDAADARYNVIQWVHRATRGWSYGGAIVDPRTGEIIKGAVTLGSQRVRQDILIAETLLSPYDGKDDGTRAHAAEAMALARLRQLSAHEVGHTLGLTHNFAASWRGNGSVMDYPHPLLRVVDGRIDLSEAYGVGVGPWDLFAIAHAYLELPPSSEAAALADLRRSARTSGLRFVGDADSRAPGSAHPDGQLWDYGPEALATFDGLMDARRLVLASFSKAVLPPDRQLGEFESRLVPVYLLHRYQTDAVARRLAGARYEYGLAGDTEAGTTPVPAAEQRAALAGLVRTLGAEELALPANVLDLMTPPSQAYGRTREDFASKTAPLFDALSAPQAAAANTCSFLFAPERLNRLVWQHARDGEQPGLREVLASVFSGTWAHDPDATQPAADEVQLAINWVVLDSVVAVLDGGQLHPQVAAEVREKLSIWQRDLARSRGTGSAGASRHAAAAWLARYLTDPATAPRRSLPAIPPGPPI